MTAEIAILNSFGVALAADSAVTISVGGVEKKIYNTANKVFMLSKYHPVGIMIYNNAKFLGIDWELTIKLYRKQLGKKSFSTLKDYANDFLKFISSNKSLFSKEQEIGYLLNILLFHLNRVIDGIREDVSKIIEQKGHVDESNIPAIIDGFVNNYLEHFKNKEDVESLSLNFNGFLKLLEKYKIDYSSIFKQELQKLPFTEELKMKVLESAYYSIKKKHVIISFSGIVFAGYGESEHFPSIESFLIEGMINREIKYVKGNDTKVDLKTRAAIIPFAQSEMVGSFMEGVDPYYQKHIDEMVGKAMERLKENIDVKKVKLIHEEFINDLKNFRRKGFVEPIINIVSSLPKDELAEMAESLVNLTSFKRRVSSESETVGGPIDVALITKCDGFVWIKRKHYFKPELNSHFFRNYYMGDCNE